MQYRPTLDDLTHTYRHHLSNAHAGLLYAVTGSTDRNLPILGSW
jgi:hypothetical protein